MGTEKKDSGNRILVGVLIFLCVLIIGLGVGISVILSGIGGRGSNSVILENGEMVSVAALDLYDEMVSKINNDSEYTSEEAIEECDSLINETNNAEYAVNLIISCGSFINNYGGGARAAAEFMENRGEEAMIGSVQPGLLENYYFLLYNYYDLAGDSEKAVFYSDKMEQVTQEKTHNNGGVW